jgi:hypothetical protein
MTFGDIYEFEYYAKTKRSLDKRPRIVFFSETDDKILGVNLNYLRIEAQTGVMDTITNQMMLENPHREEILQEVINRQERMSDEKLARILMLANMDDEDRNDDDEEQEDKTLKVENPQMSRHDAVRLMSKAIRIYHKSRISNIRKTKY